MFPLAGVSISRYTSVKVCAATPQSMLVGWLIADQCKISGKFHLCGITQISNINLQSIMQNIIKVGK